MLMRKLPGLAAGALGLGLGVVGIETPALAQANVQVGGSKRTISLQPVSFEGNTGLNVAAGIGSITLRYQPQVGRRGR